MTIKTESHHAPEVFRHMKRFSVSLIASLSIIILVVCSCGEKGDDGKNTPSGKTGTFSIIYSGNVGGKMNPCGCRIPLGGFARRTTAIQTLRNEIDNMLILDSGAMLYPHFYLYPPYDELAKMTAHIIADVSYKSGIDAQNVSSYDVVNTADTLLYFDKKYPSKWLSANIVRRGTTDLVFEPDTVYDVGNFKVGVFGFMDKQSQAIDIFNDESPLDVLDPVETVRKEVEKLKNSCDFIVALAYMDLPEVRNVVSQVPGLNVVIVSHTREHTPSSDHHKFQPLMEANTILLRCPDGGRVLGRLDLSIARGSLEFIDAAGYMDLRPASVREKDPDPLQSTYKHEFIDLGPDIERNRPIQDEINAFTEMVKAYTDKLGIEYKVQ